mmetsp:Transcript_16651/g.29641  ORF Transcript_16651/g.29641 Transcript_16651/m.29641 type:complete len:515 (+) Transcript_16651:62-1606(+)
MLANEAMGHFGLLSTRGLLLLCLLLCSEVLQVNARNLRLHSQPQRVLRADALNSTVGAVALHARGEDDIVLKVIKQTSLNSEDGTECLCKLGTFWHWRIHQCVKQGPWGYECGFFPKEHWHRVCQDNLKCEPLENATDNYHSHGLHKGTAETAPASCRSCTKEDGCKEGQTRHEEECLKQYTISGEACATVRVTLPMTAEATATKEVTVKITESKNASAKATETASHTAEVSATAKATHEGEEAEASASGKATAEHEATAEATETHEATKSATGSSTVTKKTKAQGVAEETACVTAEEVMKEMGLDPKQKVGAVLAGKIVSKANEMAFERAAAAATAAAKAAGLLDAKEAAEQLAEAEAAEEARLKAEALARQAAGWEAEAGANEAAKAAASARAKEIAKEKAKLEAERLAHLEAEAAAAKAAAEKAEAAAKAAAEAALAKNDAELKAKAEAAAAEAAAAEAAAEEAAAAAQAQKDLVDVINGPQQAEEVPRAVPTTAPKFRKITEKQMEEKLP